jgi:hypothetical protein
VRPFLTCLGETLPGLAVKLAATLPGYAIGNLLHLGIRLEVDTTMSSNKDSAGIIATSDTGPFGLWDPTSPEEVMATVVLATTCRSHAIVLPFEYKIVETWDEGWLLGIP